MRITTLRAAVFSALLACIGAPTAMAQNETEWTAVIPEAFSEYVYVWRLRADGTYFEDGYDRATDSLIQPTLTGRWRRDGAGMTLTQDDQGFVFQGQTDGTRYEGVLTQNGQRVSRFCAQRGKQIPRCDAGPGV